FTYQDVSCHKTEGDLYIRIHGKVYDVSDFTSKQRGGPDIDLDVAGGDVTDPFEDVGHSDEPRVVLVRIEVGK
ncbi:cytochrome b5, partial [Thozetella sp. PMI_491]